MEQEKLKEILNYDPTTGSFTWLHNRGTRAREGGTAGSLHKKKYISIFIDGKCYKAHRLAYIYMEGHCPKVILPLDGNYTNLKWDNLVEGFVSDYAVTRKLPSHNTSGVKNVSYDSTHEKWIGNVIYKGKSYRKSFYEKEEAIEFVAETRKELGI